MASKQRPERTPPPRAIAGWTTQGANPGDDFKKNRSSWTAEQKGMMRDAAQYLLSAKVPPGTEAYDLLCQMGCEEPTGAMVLMLAQFDQALKGSVEAAKFVRDTAGEKPEMVVNIPKVDPEATPDMLKGMSDEDLRKWVDQRVVESVVEEEIVEETSSAAPSEPIEPIEEEVASEAVIADLTPDTADEAEEESPAPPATVTDEDTEPSSI